MLVKESEKVIRTARFVCTNTREELSVITIAMLLRMTRVVFINQLGVGLPKIELSSLGGVMNRSHVMTYVLSRKPGSFSSGMPT